MLSYLNLSGVHLTTWKSLVRITGLMAEIHQKKKYRICNSDSLLCAAFRRLSSSPCTHALISTGYQIGYYENSGSSVHIQITEAGQHLQRILRQKLLIGPP